ncbi:MAG: hypothetical protein KF853_13615 [Rhodocyclaceae bacterium]|nr:hypothetical protein [Rhodocyclaceae bacterium]MBX3678050.1 hypothetical protein [Rhodocyclaceae bacterium]
MTSNIDFICHAFRGVTNDEMPWVTGFPGDPLAVRHDLWGGHAALPLPWFIRPDHNNYIAVSSFKRGDDGQHRRRKANFSRMHLVMIDDLGTKVPMKKLTLPPSALVETSPGNYQGWYFLYPPEPERWRAERLIDGMIAAGLTADASDPGMKGVTRYGRLPAGINSKAKYVEKLGGPFVQRVAVWSPLTRYSIDQIAAAYGVDMTVPANRGAHRPRRSAKLPSVGAADSTDGILNLLSCTGLYLEPANSLPGAHRIVCPWVHEHTDEDPSGSAYFEPNEQNDWRGGFKCHHGHCQDRTIYDLTHFLIRLQQISA